MSRTRASARAGRGRSQARAEGPCPLGALRNHRGGKRHEPPSKQTMRPIGAAFDGALFAAPERDEHQDAKPEVRLDVLHGASLSAGGDTSRTRAFRIRV
jgi:hypothetical protein